jgi:peptidoglycan/LPS O-acetylase OafA/YrhL
MNRYKWRKVKVHRETLPPSRHGAFDCVRLLAATAVLFSHSYALTSHEDLEPLERLTSGNAGLGELAVYAFFAISGYLVTQSWLRDPSFSRFMQRRLLRIVPALVLVICGSFLVIGPLVTTLEPQDYFTRRDAWTYLAKILIYPTQYGLPGAFESNSFPIAVNGSLWTLRLEFALYLVVAALGQYGLLRRWVSVVLVVCCAVMSALIQVGIFRGTPFLHQFLVLFLNATPYFIGAALAQSDAGSRTTWTLAAVLAALTVCLTFTIVAKVLLIATLSVAVILLCRDGQCDLSRFGDYSYGLYLWGFPIQQSVVHFVPDMAPTSLFAASGVVTFVCALVSWQGVEKVALSFKLSSTKALPVPL